MAKVYFRESLGVSYLSLSPLLTQKLMLSVRVSYLSRCLVLMDQTLSSQTFSINGSESVVEIEGE